jgi:hypothetical protein
MKRFALAVSAAILSVALAACGERQQEMTAQKSGKYQGKPDQQPWDGAKWNGDKTKWEVDLKARNQNQNEYTRTE